MNRITSLRKKKALEVAKKSVNFKNFNMDMTLPIETNYKKILSKFKVEIPADMQDKSLNECEKFINKGLKQIKFSLKRTNSDISHIITRSLLVKQSLLKKKIFRFNPDSSIKDVPIYEFKISGIKKDINDCKRYYISPGVKVSETQSKKVYLSIDKLDRQKKKCSLVSIELLKSIALCAEYCYEYLKVDSWILNDESKSYFKYKYTEEDIESLLDFSFLERREIKPTRTSMMLIIECIYNMAYFEKALALQESYSKKATSEYAKSYETKKHIPKTHLAAMNTTPLLKYFSLLELDETTDLLKFKVIEKEIINAIKKLKLNKYLKKTSELRFKRLGHHRASGLYVKGCICVDMDGPYSFIHELGHHIDLGLNGGLSLDNDFMSILRLYPVLLQKSLEKDKVEISRKKLQYYNTPTEIFARCMEIYFVNHKKVKSSLLKTENEMISLMGYPHRDDVLMKLIIKYFDNLFDFEDNLDITVNVNKPNTINKNNKAPSKGSTKDDDAKFSNIETLFDLLPEEDRLRIKVK